MVTMSLLLLQLLFLMFSFEIPPGNEARSVAPDSPKKIQSKYQQQNVNAIQEGRFGDLGVLCDLLCETVDDDYSEEDTDCDWLEDFFDGTYLCSQLCADEEEIVTKQTTKIPNSSKPSTATAPLTTSKVLSTSTTLPPSTSFPPISQAPTPAAVTTTTVSEEEVPAAVTETTTGTPAEKVTGAESSIVETSLVAAEESRAAQNETPSVAATRSDNDATGVSSRLLQELKDRLRPYKPEVTRLWCEWREIFGNNDSAALAVKICPPEMSQPEVTPYPLYHLPMFNLDSHH